MLLRESLTLPLIMYQQRRELYDSKSNESKMNEENEDPPKLSTTKIGTKREQAEWSHMSFGMMPRKMMEDQSLTTNDEEDGQQEDNKEAELSA